LTRCLAPMIGLMAALAPALACAQTNIDQGKSPAQIFAIDCAECHKAPRGLANGKNSAALTDFLREHYTTSREQAAALAAYVLGGRSTETGGAATQTRGQKPAVERASAAPAAEEPKPAKHPGRQQSSAKPEEGKPVAARPQRPTDQDAKPKNEAVRSDQPGQAASTTEPDGGRQERAAPTAAGSRRKESKTPQPAPEPAAVAHVPAAVAAEPVPAATPSPDANPSAAAPTDAAAGEPGDNVPVPRDNIPD